MEYDLWLKIGKEEMPVVIDKKLSSFRIAKGSITSERSRELLEEDKKTVTKYTNSLPILFLHKLHNTARFLVEKTI
jgi:hypothetical protein